MANEVYANNREISCKSGSGKSICAFPDVVFTPPQTPATPPGVPIPYPNTGMASDTTDGSKNVKISNKEVMLKDKSYFKKSTGDEAGSAPKKGILTSKNTGKVYFNSWSMDVKIEGENVVRHLDLTTHNHASKPGNGPPWPFLDAMYMSASQAAKCAGDRKKEEDACKSSEKFKKQKDGKKVLDKKATAKAQCKSKKCQEARKCMLTPYKPNRCCPGQTGHHLVEVHSFCERGDRGTPLPQFNGKNGKKAYDMNKAPIVCASCPRGSRYYQEHGDLHAVQGIKENAAIAKAAAGGNDQNMAWKYSDARQAGVDAHAATYPDSKCDGACIEAQLDAYHKNEVGVKDSEPVRTEPVKFKKNDPDQQARGKELITNLESSRLGGQAGGA